MVYRHLFEAIDDNYNTDEMRELFMNLGEDYENFSGDNKRRKAQELQTYMQRRRRLGELMEQMHRDRDFLDLTPFGGPGPADGSAAEPTAAGSVQASAQTPKMATAVKEEPKDTSSSYENFDIFIEPGTGDNFSLKARSLAGETGQLIYQALPTSEEYEDQVYYLRELMAKADDAEKLGQTLREFLFPKQIWELYLQTQTQARLEKKDGVRVRLNIFQESRNLYQIPWEYVRDDKTFMALNEGTPIVRYMPVNRPPSQISAPDKVRVLVAWASPSDQDLLDVESEVQVVLAALEPLKQNGRVEVEVLEHASANELRKKVRRNPPHILHFIGHGVLQENGEGALALESPSGTTALIDAEKMLVLLQGEETKLVILSACQTAATQEKVVQDSARALMGVAPKLVWGGTPAVVAMQFNLPDAAGAPFMETLYEFLADGSPLDTAVTEARIGLYFDFDDQIFWAIPVLFMRAPDGNIW